MKVISKIGLILFLALSVVLVAGYIYTNKLSKRGLPDYSATLRIEGLQAEVTVLRDSFGVPHIYAGNLHDVYMATGYIMAQDRLWQMDLLRRVTLGRLAEIFGDKYIETDLLLRSLRYSKKSNKLLNSSTPTTREAIEAFSEGVNQFITDNIGNYPFEFTLLGYTPEPWEPYHSLNLIGYMAWDLKAGWNELILLEIGQRVDSMRIAEILPDISNHKSVVFGTEQAHLFSDNKLLALSGLNNLGLDIFCGSNNWAVSGAKSESGMPLLANDMHLSFGIPGIWMQIHQVVEDELNVSGLALPGQPLVIVGHNDSIAWGMTNTYVDNLDFYEESINPEDSNQFLFNGEWLSFGVQTEEIVSKGGRINSRTFGYNHRGPVVSEAKGITDKVLTIRWVGDEDGNELQSIYNVNRAHNWTDFTNAFRTFTAISQNVAYADVKGNIGLFCAAGIPIRKRDKLYSVLPGATSEYDWLGMVPFEDLPYEYNPPNGFISSANNQTVDSTYPYHIGTWYAQPYRIDRIRQLLSEKDKLTVEDFMRMQNDQFSVYSELFLSKMLPLLDDYVCRNESETIALDLLRKWDNEMAASKIAPSLFEAWTYFLSSTLFEDELGEDLFGKFMEAKNLSRTALYNFLNSSQSAWLDNKLTPESENLQDIAILSFQQSVHAVQDKYGNDTTAWYWGNMHAITLEHPLGKVNSIEFIFNLNRGPFKTGGSFHTISPYTYTEGNPSEINHGASHRSIYDLGNWDNSYSVLPTGISGIPASRHYCDQTPLFINGLYRTDPFYFHTIDSVTRYRARFIP